MMNQLEIPERFDVVSTICSSCKIREIELNLVPALIQSHWHSTNKWLHSSSALIVRGSEPSSHILVIEDLDFEGEVFLQL